METKNIQFNKGGVLLRPLFILSLFISCSAFGQDLKTDSIAPQTLRNSVHISAGILTFPIFYFPASIIYERVLPPKRPESRVSRLVDFGIGWFQEYGESSTFGFARYGISVGKNVSHFELKAGLHYMENAWLSLFPTLDLGYRAQSPDGRHIFRVGIGLSEGGYLSWGLAF